MKIPLLAILFSALAFAQVPALQNAVPLPQPKIQILDASGRPCAGCYLWTYAAGTSTLQATYTSSTAGTPNTNPVVLDAGGAASIWIGAQSYKLVLERPPFVAGHGSVVWTVDNVTDTTFFYLTYLRSISDSALLTYTSTATGAEERTVRAKLGDIMSVKDFGAVGDGSTDDTSAISTALTAATAASACLYFPVGTYKYTTTLSLPAGGCLRGAGPVARWNESSKGSVLKYYGSTAAVKIEPIGGQTLTGVNLVDLEINGASAASSTDGLLMDATASGVTAISGVRLSNVAIRNFPKYNIHSKATTFDVDLYHVTSIGSGDDGVYIDKTGAGAGDPSQWRLFGCWMASSTSGKWAINYGYPSTVTSLTVVGSTIFEATSGGNGIKAHGGLTLTGTSVEGLGTAGTTGILYAGGNGLKVTGEVVIFWGIGIQVGDTTDKTIPAVGFTSDTIVTLNTTDFKIIDGGGRQGCRILSNGSATSPTITNLRQSVDGVYTDCYYFQAANNVNFDRADMNGGNITLTDYAHANVGIFDTSARVNAASATEAFSVGGNIYANNASGGSGLRIQEGANASFWNAATGNKMCVAGSGGTPPDPAGVDCYLSVDLSGTPAMRHNLGAPSKSQVPAQRIAFAVDETGHTLQVYITYSDGVTTKKLTTALPLTNW